MNARQRGSALPAASVLGPNRPARDAASAELRPCRGSASLGSQHLLGAKRVPRGLWGQRLALRPDEGVWPLRAVGDVGAAGGREVLDAGRIPAGHRLSSARRAGGTPARHCVPAARCSLFCRRWNWSATSAVTRAQEVPSRIPAVASESQWAAR